MEPIQQTKREKIIKIAVSVGIFVVTVVIVILGVCVVPRLGQAEPNEVAAAPLITETTTVETVAQTEATIAETSSEPTQTEAETTSAYKAKTDVKTQTATGNKAQDGDKGNDRTQDNSFSGESSGEVIEDHTETELPWGDSAGFPSKYTDYVYTDTSTLVGWQQINGALFYFDNNHAALQGMQKIGGRNYYFNEYGAKASLVGIDVSQWNGKIDWNAVKADGVDFAIVRVGFRGYGTTDLIKPPMLDRSVDTNLLGAAAAGVPVGLYFFSQAITIDEALEEAGVCVDYAKRYKITYPIYFDTEFSNPNHNGRADALTKKERTDIAVAFCEAVKNAGYTPGVYASKTFYYNELDFSRLSRYEIWMAHYTSKETDFKHKYRIWQYSDKGSINGISNATDMNISLYDYARKTNMAENGKTVVLTDKNGLFAYHNAEAALMQYEQQKTDAAFAAATEKIGALPAGGAKNALQKALSDIQTQTTAPEITTPQTTTTEE